MKKSYVYGKVKQCEFCGSKFQSRDADSKNYVAKFCSHACRNKSRTIHNPKPCNQCGEIFKPIRSSQIFCSRQCSNKHKKESHVPSLEVIINKKLAQFCCGLIHRCLRGKNDKTKNLLGYTSKELKDHLEKYFVAGMSWDNYGNGKDKWSIDHTKPISKFHPAATILEINDLENLRPMWHPQNCSKKNKWEGQ